MSHGSSPKQQEKTENRTFVQVDVCRAKLNLYTLETEANGTPSGETFASVDTVRLVYLADKNTAYSCG